MSKKLNNDVRNDTTKEEIKTTMMNESIFEVVTNRLNNKETTEEVASMIRKADTLKSIDELNMPKRAKAYLMSKFDSLDEIIWHGRCAAYDNVYYPETIKKSNKSTLDLVKALDEAGFIRHDINPGSFCIGRLYRVVFHDMIDANTIPAGVNELSNTKYESFENPTYDLYSNVEQSLQKRLAEKEFAILAYRFGFEDGNTHTFEQTGKRFRITRERVRQLEMMALRKLWRNSTLPAIFPSSDKQKTEIMTIIKEIEELKKDPVFKKEAELRQRLHEISKSPFGDAEDAARYLKNGIYDYSSIDELDLTVRAYRCLKRASISTISDIINFPKENWQNNRIFGRRVTQEIEEVVRAVGYHDFSIILS